MASGELPFYNQLQFNLGVPVSAKNMIIRHHKPNPIILDKATAPMAPKPSPAIHNESIVSNISQFSALSEDRMSMAVILAQRDIKKRKEEEKMNKVFPQRSRPTSRSPSPKSGRTRVIPGQEYWMRQKRQQVKGKTNLKVKEHDKNRNPRSVRTQTPPRPPWVGAGRVPDPSLPVTTNSPPTRDTDLYPVQKSAPSDQPDKEIERLQREMEQYLQQIQVIEQRVLSDQNTDFLQPSKSRKRDGYLSDEEDSYRRHVRSEEQATRAGRQLYSLKQQVRQIQNELIRGGPASKMKHTKKSKAMFRLAAAHRGAARAIQTFVTNLRHADLHKGLPTTYNELALLIRQLSLLSTELGSAKESTVHADLIKMLDRVDDLNKAWCKDVVDQQNDKINVSDVQERPHKSPVSKELFSVGQPKGRQLAAQPRQKGKENRPLKGVLKKPIGNKGVVKPRQVTPERKASLRAGISALLESKHPGGGVAWNIPVKQSQHHGQKSLILPANLQRKREKVQHSLPQQHVLDSHYADATVASNLKAVLHDDHERSFSAPSSPRGRDVSLSPERASRSPWRPCGTPGRSPGSGMRRTRSQSPGMSRHQFHVQDVDDNIVKTLFPEGRQSRNVLRSNFRASTGQTSPSRNRPLSSSDRLVGQAEAAIKQRLKPLLDKAEAIAQRQERMMSETNYSVRQKLADKASEQVESNGEILGDMILNDILRDTAEEFQTIELEEKMRKEAVTMQDSPTLENLMQRLEQMEVEQFEIRQRWGTVEFDEEETVSSRFIKQKTYEMEDRPSAPVAMEITKHSAPGIARQKNMAWNQEKQGEPIIFTRTKSKSQWDQKSAPQHVSGDDQEQHGYDHVTSRKAVEMNLPRNVVDSIHSNLEQYERHLKKTSHQTLGKFNPWKLVEEISDQLLDDCLKEIETELDDINSAIVNQVCKSEFMIVDTSGTQSPHAAGASGRTSPHDEVESDEHSFEITENSDSELEVVTDVTL